VATSLNSLLNRVHKLVLWGVLENIKLVLWGVLENINGIL